MPTASESKAALSVVTSAAVGAGANVFQSLSGTPVARRAALLDAIPEVVGYYTDGSSALAADFYEDARDAAGARGRFTAEPIVLDRVVKIRRGVAWASEPLFDGFPDQAEMRLAEIIQLEVARPYRDTITGNRQADPQADGWRRVTGVCCRFCRLLGDRGAVYRESTARFAAHRACDCTAEPVFRGQPVGPEASAMQYMASRRSKTPRQRAELKAYLDAFYPD